LGGQRRGDRPLSQRGRGVTTMADTGPLFAQPDADENPRRRDSERSRALAELSHTLAESIDDVHGVLDGVVRLVSSFLGDTAVIRLIEPGGEEVSVVAVGDADPAVRTAVESIVASS